MPTVLRSGAWRAVIYPNDHPPAHVHVIGPGWVVVIDLLNAPNIREVIGCDEREARSVLRVIEHHSEALLEAWRRIHG